MDIRDFSECCEKVSLDNTFTEEERQNFLKGIRPEKDLEDMTEEEEKVLINGVAEGVVSAVAGNLIK